MAKKLKYKIFLAIFIISFISSSILSFAPTDGFCGPNEKGCGAVQASPYAKTLGIKNSHYGVLVFAFLSVFTFLYIKKTDKDKRQIINAGIIISAIVSIYFLILQIFVIHEFCRYCMIVDIGALINLGIFLFWKKIK